jgi:hypothetical protein
MILFILSIQIISAQQVYTNRKNGTGGCDGTWEDTDCWKLNGVVCNCTPNGDNDGNGTNDIDEATTTITIRRNMTFATNLTIAGTLNIGTGGENVILSSTANRDLTIDAGGFLYIDNIFSRLHLAGNSDFTNDGTVDTDGGIIVGGNFENSGTIAGDGGITMETYGNSNHIDNSGVLFGDDDAGPDACTNGNNCCDGSPGIGTVGETCRLGNFPFDENGCFYSVNWGDPTTFNETSPSCLTAGNSKWESQGTLCTVESSPVTFSSITTTQIDLCVEFNNSGNLGANDSVYVYATVCLPPTYAPPFCSTMDVYKEYGNNLNPAGTQVCIDTAVSALGQVTITALVDTRDGGGPTDKIWFSDEGLNGCASPEVLPVTLINYTSVTNSDNVTLNWATATETNNHYFIIQRSTDGTNFIDIAKVYGNGNSQTKIYYTYIDEHPIKGNSYYRLKQVDYDGKSEFHGVVSAQYKGYEDVFTNKLILAPNPSTTGGSFSIFFNDTEFANSESVLIVLQDIMGKTLYAKGYTTETNVITIRLNDRIPAGTYLILASSDDKLISQILVVQ